MENNKIGSIEWVKTATIIFLAILLVLTFFSNTIMNRTLPEVASSVAESGSITARVRGTGKLTAVDNTQVKASATRYVGQINVKEGQEVKAGDLLFTMGNGDSDELEAAQDNLDALEFTLQRNQASYTTSQDTATNYRIGVLADQAQTAYDDMLAAKADYEASDQELKALGEKVTAAKTELDNAKNDLDAAELLKACDQVEQDDLVAEAQKAYDEAPEEEKAQKLIELNEAKQTREEVLAADDLIIAACETEVENTNKAYQDVKDEYDAKVASGDTSTLKTAYELARDNYYSVEYSYYSAIDSQANTDASNAKTAASAAIDVAETQSKIEKAQAKVDSLSGADPVEITAPCDGTVTSISAVAGSKVAKDDVMCIIESPDKGYTVSYSVTTDQARRIKVGDTGTISNYFWSSEITATVSSIKVDQTDPQNKKTITFDVVGDDLTTGSELTISVGSRSSSYDLIVPSSAVRTDSNGSFVLVITAKNSALGNRYYAKRVSVEVLASDDVNSAISGDLESGDFVVTTSSAPISSGDQVRMADS